MVKTFILTLFSAQIIDSYYGEAVSFLMTTDCVIYFKGQVTIEGKLENTLDQW